MFDVRALFIQAVYLLRRKFEVGLQSDGAELELFIKQAAVCIVLNLLFDPEAIVFLLLRAQFTVQEIAYPVNGTLPERTGVKHEMPIEVRLVARLKPGMAVCLAVPSERHDISQTCALQQFKVFL